MKTKTMNHEDTEDNKAPATLKLWICCHCGSPRVYGSSTECKTCGTLLHDTASYARVDPPAAPDEADKVVAQELIEGAFGKRGQSPIYQTAGRIIEELQEKFTAALAQARKEATQQTWDKAIESARAVNPLLTFGSANGSMMKKCIVTTLQSASKVER